MMFYIVFTVLVTVLVIATAYAALNKAAAEKLPLLRGGEADSPPLKKGVLWALTALAAAAGGACAFFLVRHTEDLINLAKMTIALCCLTGAAAVDLREKRIPNVFPAVMASCGLVLLILGFVTGQSGAVSYAIGNAVVAAAAGVAFMVLAFLTKHGIGAGDAKLLCALAVLVGPLPLISTVALGTTVCAVCAVVLLISKKKTAKDSLPFGPFIFVGYAAAVLLSLY